MQDNNNSPIIIIKGKEMSNNNSNNNAKDQLGRTATVTPVSGTFGGRGGRNSAKRNANLNTFTQTSTSPILARTTSATCTNATTTTTTTGQLVLTDGGSSEKSLTTTRSCNNINAVLTSGVTTTRSSSISSSLSPSSICAVVLHSPYSSSSFPITHSRLFRRLSGSGINGANMVKSTVGLEKSRNLREQVGKAIKEHKVFTCVGVYPAIRKALQKRGWIEKNPNSGSPLRYNNLGGPLKEFDNRSFEDESDQAWMSRVLRDYPPDFMWVVRRDNIDWRALTKDQVINRFPKAFFTTKVGIAACLQNMQWFSESGVSDTFFPRCYRLCLDEEKTSFIDDYRLSACMGLLKWVVSAYEREGESGVMDPGSRVVSLAVDFAVRQVNNYVRMRRHEDIDWLMPPAFMGQHWDVFLNQYYNVVLLKSKLAPSDSQDSGKLKFEAAKKALQRITPFWPQIHNDGTKNIWICKPGARSRGKGIIILNELDKILDLLNQNNCREANWVIQKYIERPLLIYKTKFDIRQWFVVSDWSPLTVWFYKESYVRFCTKPFSLDDFHESIHLCNNAVQCRYENEETRDTALPDENMWDCYTFQAYLKTLGKMDLWDSLIYPGMKQGILGVLLSSQDTADVRKNCFELYGADFMLSEDMRPWLIEINSCPCMSPSTSVTARMCAQCLEDCIKVVVDRREDKNADTGFFELIYKQTLTTMPLPFNGVDLVVHGKKLSRDVDWPSIVSKYNSKRASTGALSSRRPTQDSASLTNGLTFMDLVHRLRVKDAQALKSSMSKSSSSSSGNNSSDALPNSRGSNQVRNTSSPSTASSSTSSSSSSSTRQEDNNKAEGNKKSTSSTSSLVASASKKIMDQSSSTTNNPPPPSNNNQNSGKESVRENHRCPIKSNSPPTTSTSSINTSGEKTSKRGASKSSAPVRPETNGEKVVPAVYSHNKMKSYINSNSQITAEQVIFPFKTSNTETLLTALLKSSLINPTMVDLVRLSQEAAAREHAKAYGINGSRHPSSSSGAAAAALSKSAMLLESQLPSSMEKHRKGLSSSISTECGKLKPAYSTATTPTTTLVNNGKIRPNARINSYLAPQPSNNPLLAHNNPKVMDQTLFGFEQSKLGSGNINSSGAREQPDMMSGDHRNNYSKLPTSFYDIHKLNTSRIPFHRLIDRRSNNANDPDLTLQRKIMCEYKGGIIRNNNNNKVEIESDEQELDMNGSGHNNNNNNADWCSNSGSSSSRSESSSLSSSASSSTAWYHTNDSSDLLHGTSSRSSGVQIFICNPNNSSPTTDPEPSTELKSEGVDPCLESHAGYNVIDSQTAPKTPVLMRPEGPSSYSLHHHHHQHPHPCYRVALEHPTNHAALLSSKRYMTSLPLKTVNLHLT